MTKPWVTLVVLLFAPFILMGLWMLIMVVSAYELIEEIIRGNHPSR